MRFQPPFCPAVAAGHAQHAGFQYQRRGSYVRHCDGRRVQRFICTLCRTSFSSQTFRFDYRHKRPSFDHEIFLGFVSKVSQRQIARNRPFSRKVVARRLRRFGAHGRAFHERQLGLLGPKQAWPGAFQLDELETFEHNRRLRPLTVPVLIHRPSYCVLHTAVGTLPARKPLSPRNQEKLRVQEEKEGKRRSESRIRVRECFERLGKVGPQLGPVRVRTDEKTSYATELKRVFGERLVHRTTASKVPKCYENPLFPINHTLAMLRDGLSRLVRRNWGTTKKAWALDLHLWTWIAWRNYVRPITNSNAKETPAMVAGLIPGKLELADLLRWRVFPHAPHSLGGQSPVSACRVQAEPVGGSAPSPPCSRTASAAIRLAQERLRSRRPAGVR